jgi:hypothetical protein
MQEYKKYIMSLFKGRTVHFECNCLLHLNVTGQIVDTELINNEVIFILIINGKRIKIGENTPGLKFEFV